MTFLRTLFSTGTILAICVAAAQAAERPLIWEFSKESDTAYNAKLGSRLPARTTSSLGADFRMRGPDPERFDNPVTFWISTHLAERRNRDDIHAMNLNARIDAVSGNGNISVRNSLMRHWALLEAEVNQQVSIEFRPAEERRRFVRQTQEVLLRAPSTGTGMRVHTARTDAEAWRTSFAVTQRLRDSIELSASIEQPGTRSEKSRVGARYHYQW